MLGNILKLPNCQNVGDSLKEFGNEIFHALYFIPQTSVTSSNFAIKKNENSSLCFVRTYLINVSVNFSQDKFYSQSIMFLSPIISGSPLEKYFWSVDFWWFMLLKKLHILFYTDLKMTNQTKKKSLLPQKIIFQNQTLPQLLWHHPRQSFTENTLIKRLSTLQRSSFRTTSK